MPSLLRSPRPAAARSAPAVATPLAVLLTATFLAVWPTTADAQRSAELTAITDTVFAQWNSTSSPGCAVGIARGGRTLLTRAYGMADLNASLALTPTTILESGSVAKQFTATAVLLLAADGKLALEDDARRYLPELPTYDRPITIRHLLTHTSGLREWSNLVAWQGWPRGTRMHTQDYAYDLITRQRSLNYPVGDAYSYTNSGFLLLRTLVERVSGQSFEQFTEQRIFAPLGMRHTSWRGDFTRVVPGLAQAYRRAGNAWRIDMPMDHIIAAGGLYTTVEDWLRWNTALTSRTLGAAVTDSLTQRMTLTSGLQIQYALGLMVREYRGLTEIAHSGSTAGYSTFLARYPTQDDLSIAVLCNAAGAGATGYARAIVDAMVPGLPPAAAPDTVRLDGAALMPWRGLYRDTRTNDVVLLDSSGGRWRRDSTPLRALRDGSYQAGGTRFRLELAADGTRTMTQATSDGDSVRAVRVAEQVWEPTAGELAGLAGSYHSEEIGTTYTVTVRDGRLTVSPRVGMVDVLRPTYRDAFAGPGEAVWFERDRRGRVTAMHFGAGRAWDFRVPRVR